MYSLLSLGVFQFYFPSVKRPLHSRFIVRSYPHLAFRQPLKNIYPFSRRKKTTQFSLNTEHWAAQKRQRESTGVVQHLQGNNSLPTLSIQFPRSNNQSENLKSRHSSGLWWPFVVEKWKLHCILSCWRQRFWSHLLRITAKVCSSFCWYNLLRNDSYFMLSKRPERNVLRQGQVLMFRRTSWTPTNPPLPSLTRHCSTVIYYLNAFEGYTWTWKWLQPLDVISF